MTQQDTYKLEFKVAAPDKSWEFYMCTRLPQSSMHPIITNILACLSKTDTAEFIQQLDHAMANSSQFEKQTLFEPVELDYIYPDSSTDALYPNAIKLGNEMIVSLHDFRQLLQEWLDFMTQNPIKKASIKF